MPDFPLVTDIVNTCILVVVIVVVVIVLVVIVVVVVVVRLLMFHQSQTLLTPTSCCISETPYQLIRSHWRVASVGTHWPADISTAKGMLH